ncbi:MAG: hypothetical protein J5714_00730 [Alphaproteobacteria bacterium]|nr:hypothetical protein [Alphaproteobacteria bacterium]
MKAFDKYFLCCFLVLCFAGHCNAQNARQNRRRQKVENVTNDTLKTMTHTVPIKAAPQHIQKNPKVKISNADEALYLELETFTNAKMNNVKCVFSPLVVIKPFIRFYDKLDIGITTTQMVQNYTSENMSTITHDMYAYAKLRASGGNYSIRAGNFSVLNYAAQFAKSMPINNFFINSMYFKSGHYYPRAIIAGFSNTEMGIHIGYAEEDTKGMQFTGNGAVVIASEIFIEDSFKGGALMTIGKENTVIDLQMSWTPNPNNALLLELSNIGDQAGFHGTYRHNFVKGNINIFVNGFKQLGDGIAGGSLGLGHKKSGAYAAIGATKHDPMNKMNPDEKFVPYAEFGIVHGFYPISKNR